MSPILICPPSINALFRVVPPLHSCSKPKGNLRRNDFGAHFVRMESKGSEQAQQVEKNNKTVVPLLTPYKMGPFDLSHR